MPRYKLRTLLVLLAVLPPLIAGVVQYRNWRDRQLWRSLERAKVGRDAVLQEWRTTYGLFQAGQVSARHECALRQQYFAARQDVESARTAIEARYGSFEKGLQEATHAAKNRKLSR